MQQRRPRATDRLVETRDDVLAYMAFPAKHRTRIYSTNPLERLNKEIKRCTNVVGVFSDRPSVIRLVGAILIEVHDGWQVGRRYLSLATMRELTDREPLLGTTPASLRLAPVH